MEKALSQTFERSLMDDPKTMKRVELNYRRNKEQDNTAVMDELSRTFNLNDCKNHWWNPERFSFLYGTRLWDESSETQRKLLNQIYWVAYYSQIISAEIATIYFNQTSAAGLYGLEDFRIVCDTLDLESAQERAHINAFKTVSERFELETFGKRIFTYPMRGPFVETMIFRNKSRIESYWRSMQIKAFALMSSSNAFLGCQYFTVRGLRTLNGKIVQHQLSQFYSKASDAEKTLSAIPSRISYHHFMDESYHFNTSLLISTDILKSVPKPTRFESWVANRGITGSQVDHFNFSTAINGLFWYDPALYPNTYEILRSKHFGLSDQDARQMMKDCFTRESEGAWESFKSREIALQSYKEYVSKIDYVNATNREMKVMSRNSMAQHLAQNTQEFALFSRTIPSVA